MFCPLWELRWRAPREIARTFAGSACDRSIPTAQETLQIKGIVPSFTVDDLQKSITFYEGLGFAVDERWEDNGTLLGVMLRAGNNRVGLSQDDWKKGRDRKKGVGMRVFIATTQNVDEIAGRAKRAGIKLDADPHDTECGTAARLQ